MKTFPLHDTLLTDYSCLAKVTLLILVATDIVHKIPTGINVIDFNTLVATMSTLALSRRASYLSFSPLFSK